MGMDRDRVWLGDGAKPGSGALGSLPGWNRSRDALVNLARPMKSRPSSDELREFGGGNDAREEVRRCSPGLS